MNDTKTSFANLFHDHIMNADFWWPTLQVVTAIASSFAIACGTGTVKAIETMEYMTFCRTLTFPDGQILYRNSFKKK